MGLEYRITFEVDPRQRFAVERAEVWPAARDRLRRMLLAMPGVAPRAEALELRVEGCPAEGMPTAEIVLGATDVYVCDYGGGPGVAELVGRVVLEMANAGLVVHVATLE